MPDHSRNKRAAKLAPGAKFVPQQPTTKRPRVQFGVPGAKPAAAVTAVENATPDAKPAKLNRERIKADPLLVAKARELRDRWLEHVNAGGAGAILIESAGKYDVTRALPAGDAPVRLLPAA